MAVLGLRKALRFLIIVCFFRLLSTSCLLSVTWCDLTVLVLAVTFMSDKGVSRRSDLRNLPRARSVGAKLVEGGGFGAGVRPPEYGERCLVPFTARLLDKRDAVFSVTADESNYGTRFFRDGQLSKARVVFAQALLSGVFLEIVGYVLQESHRRWGRSGTFAAEEHVR